MNDPDIMLLGDIDDALKERQLDAMPRWVRREVQYQHLWFGVRIANRYFKLFQETRLGLHWNVPEICTRNYKTVRVDWVTRIGH